MREERRRAPRPSTMIGYLEQLTALTLLERLATPVLAVCDEGFVLYANPACEALLGHGALAGQPLNRLHHACSELTAAECVRVLREASGGVTTWHHPELGMLYTVVSPPLLVRADDPVLLVTLIDVTEWLWNLGSEGAPPLHDLGCSVDRSLGSGVN